MSKKIFDMGRSFHKLGECEIKFGGETFKAIGVDFSSSGEKEKSIITVNPARIDKFRQFLEDSEDKLWSTAYGPIEINNRWDTIRVWDTTTSNTSEQTYTPVDRKRLRSILRELLAEEFKELNMPELLESKKVAPAAILPYGNLHKRKLKRHAHTRTDKEEIKEG